MMKILFLCVFLANIVFFIWEFRKGAPEVYLPPSYENSIGIQNHSQKIMLLSELPEAMRRTSEADLNSEKHAQQSEVPSDTEVANETLIESKQPVIVNNETGKPSNNEILTGNNYIEPLNEVLELSEEENTQSNQSITPLPAQNATESTVNNNPAEQKTRINTNGEKLNVE